MIVRESSETRITGSLAVAQLLRDILKVESEIDRNKEHFWCLGLDVKNKVMFIDLCSLGTLDQSLVHPREVFRLAVSKGVATIIVGHNHPSGDPEPSQRDKDVTDRLVKAGDILGIRLLDHVIIGHDSHVSLKDRGYIS